MHSLLLHGYAAGCQVVPLSRDKLTLVISASRLASVWTPERALEYLLMGGLLPEAVWFAGQLGDWKAQICLSGVIHYYRQNTTDNRIRSVVPLAE